MPEHDVSSVVVLCVDDPPAALALVDTAPAAGGTGVEREVAPRLTFDRPLAAATTAPGSVRLSTASGLVWPIDLETDLATITVRPRAVLPGDTGFTLTIDASISAQDGGRLGRSLTSPFRTRPQAWAPSATALATFAIHQVNDAPAALLALADRRFLAVWFRNPVFPDQVVLATTSAGAGLWGDAMPVDTVAPGNTIQGHSFRAMAETGDSARLAWIEQGPNVAVPQVRTSTYSMPDGRPSVPATLTAVPDGGSSMIMDLASDGSGDTLLVVRGTTPGGVNALFAIRRDPASAGWSQPVQLPGTAGRAVDFGVWPDRRGGFIVLWVESRLDGLPWLYASRTNGAPGTWTEPVLLAKQLVMSSIDAVSMVVDPSGRATAGWMHWIGVAGSPELHTARFDPAAGAWSPPVRVDRPSTTTGVNGPALAVDAAGKVLATWGEYRGSFAARFDPSMGAWSEPLLVDPGSQGGTRLAVDPVGNATLVTTRDHRVRVLRYSATDDRWAVAEAIDGMPPATTLTAGASLLAMNGSGDVAATWYTRIDDGGIRALLAANVFR